MEILAVILIAVLVAIILLRFTIVIANHRMNDSLAILQSWADDNHYQIIKAELRWFFPEERYWWIPQGRRRLRRDTSNYYVQILDAAGTTRKAFVKCDMGSYGYTRGVTHVRWDDES